MTSRREAAVHFSVLLLLVFWFTVEDTFAQAEIVEIYCPSCGFRERFVQGSTQADYARNIQRAIVVCERTPEIKNVVIALDPDRPVRGEPLVARQYGTGTSKMLGLVLPKFLVPGSTCPLFPVTAYLDANLCPVCGMAGIQYGIVGQY